MPSGQHSQRSHLEQWHAAWQTQAIEIREPTTNHAALIIRQSNIENSLVNALMNSPAWILDEKKWARRRALCLTKEACESIDRTAKEVRLRRIDFHSFDDALQFNVTQYQLRSLKSLKDKLARYQVGTAFHWQKQNDDGSAGQRLHDKIKTYIEARGAKLDEISH